MLAAGERGEFRQIVASLTERPLDARERERLWQLLERHPQWVAEYVAHCELPALMTRSAKPDLAGAPIIPLHPARQRAVDLGTGAASPRASKARVALLSGLIGAAAASAFAVLHPGSTLPGDGAPARRAAGGSEASPQEIGETPQQIYERMSPRLPAQGSLRRPAARG